jgi:hypothetical protein
MKSTKLMAVGAMLLLAVGGATGQSLGDYARSVRKNKVEPSSASRHFDNDNIPTVEGLSVVGPPPDGDAKSTASAKPDAVVPAASAAADRQKAADDWTQKLNKQKEKVDSLVHELDLQEREYRLRAAALYSDPTARMRNPTQWDNDDAKIRTDLDAKQKAVDAARQELSDMQEQAHKAGVVDKEKDTDTEKGK